MTVSNYFNINFAFMFYRGPQIGLDTNTRIFLETFRSFRDIKKILGYVDKFIAFFAVFQLFQFSGFPLE